MSKINEIQVLLSKKAELNARLSLLPYDGTPEIKTISGKDYLYVRKRVLNKVTSTYVDVYSDKLYNNLLRNNEEAKKLRREIRKIDKALASFGYKEEYYYLMSFSAGLCAKNRNALPMIRIILGNWYNFSRQKQFSNKGIIKNARAEDVQKNCNLKERGNLF